MDNKGYYFNKILVLTDGTCGSACSYFASKLLLNKKAWVVSMGGVVGTEMGIASFAGGNVFDWTPYLQYLKGYLNETNQNYNGTLDYLPTSAATRYNFGEVYIGSDDIPREYLHMKPSDHINNWDFTNPLTA